jgi:hypothetical protein
MVGRAASLVGAILLANPIFAQENCTATFPAPIGATIGPGAAAGLLRWQTSPGCQWAVADSLPPPAWLSFTQTFDLPPNNPNGDTEANDGLVAGTGSGVLPFSVIANTSPSPRSMTLQFVGDFPASFTITQEGQASSRPSIESFSPTQDSGFSATFTLQIFDASGYQSVSGVSVVFDTSPSTGPCSVRFFQTGGQGYLTLLSDDGSSYLPPALLPGNGTVANSLCQVNAAGSSFSGSGNNAALNIALTFPPGFAGSKLVFGSATDAGNSVSPVNEIGQWTVGPSNPLHVSMPSPLYFTYSPGDPAGAQSGFTLEDQIQPITAQTSTVSGGGWLSATVYPPNSLPPLVVKADPAGLPIGTYTGAVAISAEGAQTVNVPVSMTVTPPPTLAVSSSSVNFSVPFFCPSPQPATVAITSTGGSVAIGVSVSGSPNVTVSLDQAVTPAVLTITANTAGGYASPSQTLASVVVSSPGQKNVTILIFVQVTSPPPLFYNLNNVAITLGVTPGNAQSQTVPVDSAACFGTPTFTTTVSMTPPGTWLSASTSGLITGQTLNGLPVDTTNLTVSVNANGLAPGNYFGSVFASDGHGLSPAAALVATVYAQPQITVAPASLVFIHQIQVTAPAPQTIQVATPGTPGSASALPYTMSVSQGSNTAQCGTNWLAATPTGGTTTGTSVGVPVTVSYSTAGLAVGAVYLCSGEITVALPGTAILPVSIPVSLNVTTAATFFNGEVSLNAGVFYLQFPDGNQFGYYNFASNSIIYNYNLGFEAFILGSASDIYLYDFTSGHWWYSSTALFPFLYDFTLNSWLYYSPPRSFSNLTTGKIFTL